MCLGAIQPLIMQIDIIDAALISLGALYLWWFKGYFAQQIQTAPTQKVALDAPQPETPPSIERIKSL